MNNLIIQLYTCCKSQFYIVIIVVIEWIVIIKTFCTILETLVDPFHQTFPLMRCKYILDAKSCMLEIPCAGNLVPTIVLEWLKLW